MSQAKVAILLPIGRLDRFGYQHLYRLILQNHCEFADKVFLLASTRFVSPDLFREYRNAELVSLEVALPDLIDGREAMNLSKFSDGFDQCQLMIKNQGYDVCLNIHINQYVPRRAFEPLRAICNNLVKNDQPYAWLYKRYQLRDLLFDADCRLPWIVNLHGHESYRFGADSIRNEKTNAWVRIEFSDYLKFNNQAIVDVLGEHTLQDAQAKYEYTIKEHRKLNGTYNPNDASNLVFNPGEYFRYNLGKINRKRISQDKLDEFGTEIFNRSRPDFVSRKFRAEYSPSQPSWRRRLIRSLTGRAA